MEHREKRTTMDTYIKTTLSVAKNAQEQLEALMETYLPAITYEVFGDTDAEDVITVFGEIYDDAGEDADRFGVQFYVLVADFPEIKKIVSQFPAEILVEHEEITFSLEAALEGHKERFHFTNACEIIYDVSELDTSKEHIQIIMPPQNAFGTGSHNTTRLLAQLLELYVTKETAVLDVGTGTGILAIYAAKLGAPVVLATDYDAQAVAEAIIHSQENAVADKLHIEQHDFLDGVSIKPYQLIVANLSWNIFPQFMTSLLQQQVFNKKYLFSGLKRMEMADFEVLLKDYGFTIERYLQEEDWVAYVANR